MPVFAEISATISAFVIIDIYKFIKFKKGCKDSAFSLRMTIKRYYIFPENDYLR